MTTPPRPTSTDWNDVRSWRVQLRKDLIAQRLARSQDERVAAVKMITAQLRERVDLTAYPRVGIYWPVRGEIDLRELALEHLRQGGQVSLPVVVQPAAPVEFWDWHEQTPMSRGVWNIPIPRDRQVTAPKLLLVPLVGFDGNHYRLGYGGGYYDRTLAAASPRPRCIGVGYANSQIESIFPQPHDIPMDEIVTVRL
jgi:5-formyltetrahydrofolate cyclo-ligase